MNAGAAKVPIDFGPDYVSQHSWIAAYNAAMSPIATGTANSTQRTWIWVCRKDTGGPCGHAALAGINAVKKVQIDFGPDYNSVLVPVLSVRRQDTGATCGHTVTVTQAVKMIPIAFRQ